MIDIAEKDVQMDPEGSRSDGDVPELQTPALGVCAMERERRKALQSGRSEDKDDALYVKGYGEGYVDGYDHGQWNGYIGLLHELEGDLAMVRFLYGHDGEAGLFWALEAIRERLEHEP